MADDTPPRQLSDGEIDTKVPHSARVWNYWLGGIDNFAIDRQVGEQVAQMFPNIVAEARASRNFLTHAVRYLAGEAGIRQFLDVGSGLPTVDNTHQIAQRVAPGSRIVYVDHDPMVLAYAHGLLTSNPEGATEFVAADLRDPATILDRAARTLDFAAPVALILNGVMGHITSDDEALSIVSQLVAGLAPGSYLSLCDGSDASEAGVKSMEFYRDSGAIPYHLRSPDQIARFFDGLELVEPGVVTIDRWYSGPTTSGEPAQGYGGIARKP